MFEFLEMLGLEGPEGRERRRTGAPRQRGLRGMLGRMFGGGDLEHEEDGGRDRRDKRDGNNRRRPEHEHFDFDD